MSKNYRKKKNNDNTVAIVLASLFIIGIMIYFFKYYLIVLFIITAAIIVASILEKITRKKENYTYKTKTFYSNTNKNNYQYSNNATNTTTNTTANTATNNTSLEKDNDEERKNRGDIKFYNYVKEKQNKRKEYEEKGKKYELQVGKHFETLGYYIIYNGINNRKKDEGIDLIAIKYDEIKLIQCKNWTKRKINQQLIRAFLWDCHQYLTKHPEYNKRKVERLIVIPDKILTKAAYAYIKQNNSKINYKIIPFLSS